MGAGFAAGVVVFPWLVLGARLRSRHGALTRAMMDIFARRRATRAEWAEACRLIRLSRPDVLRYGVGGRLERYCL